MKKKREETLAFENKSILEKINSLRRTVLILFIDFKVWLRFDFKAIVAKHHQVATLPRRRG